MARGTPQLYFVPLFLSLSLLLTTVDYAIAAKGAFRNRASKSREVKVVAEEAQGSFQSLSPLAREIAPLPSLFHAVYAQADIDACVALPVRNKAGEKKTKKERRKGV
jgi:hypothetical protein